MVAISTILSVALAARSTLSPSRTHELQPRQTTVVVEAGPRPTNTLDLLPPNCDQSCLTTQENLARTQYEEAVQKVKAAIYREDAYVKKIFPNGPTDNQWRWPPTAPYTIEYEKIRKETVAARVQEATTFEFYENVARAAAGNPMPKWLEEVKKQEELAKQEAARNKLKSAREDVHRMMAGIEEMERTLVWIKAQPKLPFTMEKVLSVEGGIMKLRHELEIIMQHPLLRDDPREAADPLAYSGDIAAIAENSPSISDTAALPPPTTGVAMKRGLEARSPPEESDVLGPVPPRVPSWIWHTRPVETPIGFGSPSIPDVDSSSPSSATITARATALPTLLARQHEWLNDPYAGHISNWVNDVIGDMHEFENKFEEWGAGGTKKKRSREEIEHSLAIQSLGLVLNGHPVTAASSGSTTPTQPSDQASPTQLKRDQDNKALDNLQHFAERLTVEAEKFGNHAHENPDNDEAQEGAEIVTHFLKTVLKQVSDVKKLRDEFHQMITPNKRTKRAEGLFESLYYTLAGFEEKVENEFTNPNPRGGIYEMFHQPDLLNGDSGQWGPHGERLDNHGWPAPFDTPVSDLQTDYSYSQAPNEKRDDRDDQYEEMGAVYEWGAPLGVPASMISKTGLFQGISRFLGPWFHSDDYYKGDRDRKRRDLHSCDSFRGECYNVEEKDNVTRTVTFTPSSSFSTVTATASVSESLAPLASAGVAAGVVELHKRNAPGIGDPKLARCHHTAEKENTGMKPVIPALAGTTDPSYDGLQHTHMKSPRNEVTGSSKVVERRLSVWHPTRCEGISLSTANVSIVIHGSGIATTSTTPTHRVDRRDHPHRVLPWSSPLGVIPSTVSTPASATPTHRVDRRDHPHRVLPWSSPLGIPSISTPSPSTSTPTSTPTITHPHAAKRSDKHKMVPWSSPIGTVLSTSTRSSSSASSLDNVHRLPKTIPCRGRSCFGYRGSSRLHQPSSTSRTANPTSDYDAAKRSENLDIRPYWSSPIGTVLSTITSTSTSTSTPSSSSTPSLGNEHRLAGGVSWCCRGRTCYATRHPTTPCTFQRLASSTSTTTNPTSDHHAAKRSDDLNIHPHWSSPIGTVPSTSTSTPSSSSTSSLDNEHRLAGGFSWRCRGRSCFGRPWRSRPHRPGRTKVSSSTTTTATLTSDYHVAKRSDNLSIHPYWPSLIGTIASATSSSSLSPPTSTPSSDNEVQITEAWICRGGPCPHKPWRIRPYLPWWRHNLTSSTTTTPTATSTSDSHAAKRSENLNVKHWGRLRNGTMVMPTILHPALTTEPATLEPRSPATTTTTTPSFNPASRVTSFFRCHGYGCPKNPVPHWMSHLPSRPTTLVTRKIVGDGDGDDGDDATSTLVV